MAMRGLRQRNIVAEVHGVFDAALRILQAAESGIMVRVASFRLIGVILQSRNSAALTTQTATVAVNALGSTFSAIMNDRRGNYSALAIFLDLMPVIDAISCHPEGTSALRSPRVVEVLVALLDITAKERRDVAEVCAAQINALCRDPYHVDILKRHHHFVAVFIHALNVKHAVALQFYCISILDCIARSLAHLGLDVDAGHGAYITLCNLSNADHVMTPTLMRLSKLLELECLTQGLQRDLAPNLPTSKAAASAAAALVAL